jgi:hypothetical protein
VSLLHRIGYVNDTIAMLDRAKQMSGGQVFVVNWNPEQDFAATRILLGRIAGFDQGHAGDAVHAEVGVRDRAHAAPLTAYRRVCSARFAGVEER